MRSTDDPDEDSQLGPERTDARPRGDSSAVARFDVADLEPASLRKKVVREQESSTEASPQKARYKARSTKTEAFSRKTVHSNK